MGPNPLSSVYLSRRTFRHSYTLEEYYVMTEAETGVMSL